MTEIIKPILTKKHYTRLRYYWQSGVSGGGTRCDNYDLDLIAHGFIQRTKDRWNNVVHFSITPEGEMELSHEKQREIGRRKPHHTLGEKFAKSLQDNGRITWENIEFKIEDVDLAGNKTVQCVRPDVFSMMPTFNEDKMNPTTYEVKVSRSDFLVDVNNPNKRAGSQKISEAFYYVCPEGLIKKEEVPVDCGLIYENKFGGFDVIKRVKKKKVTLSAKHFMNLILKKGRFNSFND
jgi:hypothetical protein